MLNFVENLLENERGPMNDQDLTKTDYDPDCSLVLIEGLSHFLTNFLQNLASCQTSFRKQKYLACIFLSFYYSNVNFLACPVSRKFVLKVKQFLFRSCTFFRFRFKKNPRNVLTFVTDITMN
jgi:hypothetical protein